MKQSTTPRIPRSNLIGLAALVCALAGTSQAQTPAPAPTTAAPGPNVLPPPPAPAPAPPAPAPRPFKEIVKDAKELKGFFTLYQKDEKVWLEIKPEQFGKPFFFSYNIANGLGERGLYGSQMGRSYQAEFRKIGSQVQLIANNTEYVATPGTPQARAVAQAFSASLLASASVLSAPHPDSKGVLVDASALLFNDIAGYTTALENAYRLVYALDKPNTSFGPLNVEDKLTGMLVNAHFSVTRIAAPPLTPPTTPVPTPPTTTPDPRSFFVGFYYNFAALPEQPMRARLADDRVGHFVTTSQDFTEDTKPKTSRHYVNRWRLEKKDPAAAVSEPVQPIVFWLDKNIPQKYRKSITEGVLEWNKAFEKIGFKNALVARQQQDSDSFDTLDARHASIRWFVGADVGFAIGPSKVDARSGEILDADIGMSDVFARGIRRMVAEDQPGSATHRHDGSCDYAQEASMEMGFAMELLEARGDMDMDSPQAEALAQAYVKNVIVHEVGHTLGLRHNFRSSTIYTLKQLQDKAFTQANGLAGSVMDYIPFNLAVKGEPQGEYIMSNLGPYDYWAVEYAYKPIDADKEKDELARIAGRSTEPLLAYGTDEDSSGTQVSDPAVNTFDLGAEPLVYVQKRLTMSRELWDRLQKRKLKDGDSYESLRRSFEYGFGQFARTVPLATKYVGGTTFLRDHAGTGRATYTPVPVQQQRQALKLVSDSLFTAKSFVFSPELLSRLGVDHLQRGSNRNDITVSARLLGLQTAALDQLMSDTVAQRLLSTAEKVRSPKDALPLDELYGSLQTAIWSELTTGGDISGARRNLQREHLKRLANGLIRPSAATPADVRSLQREQATRLLASLRAAQGKPMSPAARAHLLESQATLAEVLKASLVRSGV